jgi:hypothetical protein
VPFETRLFVKTGMIYLVLTFAVGAVLAAMEAAGHPAPFIIAVEHGHMGFIGWLVNVVVGVALWMFPLDRERFPETKGRYHSAIVLWCYGLLNVGLPMRIFSESWLALAGAEIIVRFALVLSAAMQLAAIVLVACIVWARVRQPAPVAKV